MRCREGVFEPSPTARSGTTPGRSYVRPHVIRDEAVFSELCFERVLRGSPRKIHIGPIGTPFIGSLLSEGTSFAPVGARRCHRDQTAARSSRPLVRWAIVRASQGRTLSASHLGRFSEGRVRADLEQRSFEDVSVEVTNVHDPKTIGRLSDPEEIVRPSAKFTPPTPPSGPGSRSTAGCDVA